MNNWPDDGFGWIGMSEGKMIGCMGRDSACHGCCGRSVAVNVCRDWMSVLAARWHLYHRGEGSLAAGSWRGGQARQNTRTVAPIAALKVERFPIYFFSAGRFSSSPPAPTPVTIPVTVGHPQENK